MIPAGVPPPPEQVAVMSGPTAVIAQTAGMMDNGETADGRKKRELSQSKRAAQNRAAQRAFRQRKEGYIKKLEQQVQEFNQMEESFKAMQAENFQLREYIVHLQSRLLESQGNYPPPPDNISLAHPSTQGGRIPEGGPAGVVQPPPGVGAPPQGQQQQQQQQPQQVVPAPNPLEVAAQAVAGLSRSEQHRGPAVDPYAGLRAVAMRNEADDVNTAEEITRQLQGEGGQEGNLPEAAM
ncbi:putative transcription factor kapC [Cercophora samala]|uniref:Putative transcription factor kapC n=1 Tax=Cercophora samala TaxID=330535 RepID=A0AA39Z7Z2_9PEZI|nr:putative transcription factor kapC [Cercophora samala]